MVPFPVTLDLDFKVMGN